MLHNIRFTVD